MSVKVTGLISWLKNWFYDKNEVDSLVSAGIGNLTQKQQYTYTYSSKTLTITVYSDEVYVYVTVGGDIANSSGSNGVTTISDTTISTNYRPPYIIRFITHPNLFYIHMGTDGTLKVSHSTTSGGTTSITGSVMYPKVSRMPS